MGPSPRPSQEESRGPFLWGPENPENRYLYARLTIPEYRHSAGESLGELEGWKFWEMTDRAKIIVDSTLMRFGPSQRGDYGLMVGRDVDHAQPTIIKVGTPVQDEIIEEFRAAQGKLYYYNIGFIILNSRHPAVLEMKRRIVDFWGRKKMDTDAAASSLAIQDSASKSDAPATVSTILPGLSSSERPMLDSLEHKLSHTSSQRDRVDPPKNLEERPVFPILESGANLNRPPYRVTLPPLNGNGWIIRTLGGIVTNGKDVFGVTVGSILGADEVGSLQDSGSTPIPKPHVVRLGTQLDESAASILSILPTRGNSSRPSKSRRPAFTSSHYVGMLVQLPVDQKRQWALIRLKSNMALPNDMIEPSADKTIVIKDRGLAMLPGEVWISTARGVIVGQCVSAEPEEQQRWVLVEERLSQKDCGSWVIDAKSKKLLGLVTEVLGNRVILLSAWRMWREIEALKLGVIKLPQPRSPDSPESNPNKTDSPEESMARNPKLPPSNTLPKLLPLRPLKHNSSGKASEGGTKHVTISQTTMEAILCCFRSKSSTSKFAYTESRGERFGEVNNQVLFELRGEGRDDWRTIKPQIERLIRRTPSKSKHISDPIVVVEGFMVGDSPTVVIISESSIYASQLRSAIQRSSILGSNKFKVLIADGPIDTTAPDGDSADERV